MQKHIDVLAGLLIVLFAVFASAQTSGKSRQSSAPATSTQTTTTQTTTTTSTATSRPKNIEGCLIKEQADYFLVPRAGNPIKLQAKAGENLAEHEGHKVRISGNETPISSASSSMTSSSSGGVTGTATATTGVGSHESPSAGGAMGASTGTPATSETGAATGSGNDLHKLATQELTVTKLQHIAATCPLNWNSRVRSSSGTAKP